ncbi:MAG: GNAT family N-acetyltransferase [Polyangiales bacterium]
MARTTAEPKLVVKALTPATWSDFEKLFTARSGPKYCWCMAWRVTAEERQHNDPPARKKALSRRVHAGTPVGLLGYVAGEPVAWCSLAPRNTLVRLVTDHSPDTGVWSITCFFIQREHRKQGLTRRMLTAAISYARKRGAKVVEGTPVTADSPSYRHMGFVPLFAEAGFAEVGREGSRRHVMRRVLRGGQAKPAETKTTRPRPQAAKRRSAGGQPPVLRSRRSAAASSH